jgi:membrane associated rhomboid family serine protease
MSDRRAVARMDELQEDRSLVPLVTVGLALTNLVVFLFELSLPSGALQTFVEAWGVVPREYALARDLPPSIPLPFWITLATSMFLHGGWAHLFGNLLYLLIFGNLLERRLGGARFLGFYLICGVLAALVQVSAHPFSDLPTVGASGAISGALGGYVILYRHGRPAAGLGQVAALCLLMFWVLIQLLSVPAADADGGIARMAHAGGFVAGALLYPLFVNTLPQVPSLRLAVPPAQKA